jgi:hypothetical protein
VWNRFASVFRHTEKILRTKGRPYEVVFTSGGHDNKGCLKAVVKETQVIDQVVRTMLPGTGSKHTVEYIQTFLDQR